MSEALMLERLATVRSRFAEWQIDALLIGSGANLRWLSGFTGSAGWLIVTETKAVLATDFRYWEQATIEAGAFELFKIQSGRAEFWRELFGLVDVMRIGVESQHIRLAEYRQLQKNEGIIWRELPDTLESFRYVKSDEEVESIRRAAAITDQAMARAAVLAQPGISEKALAWELEKAMREAGATGLSFPVIVASGPNAAMAHHTPGSRNLRDGDPLIIDLGAEWNGYQSDLTRSYFVGSIPDAHFRTLYNIVLEANSTARNRLHAGMTGREVDALARDVIIAAGHGDHFGHALGHGVGLVVHEGPRLSSSADKQIVPAGAVVTIEPGVYIPGWGGIRIEDLVLVTESGAETLSHCPNLPAFA